MVICQVGTSNANNRFDEVNRHLLDFYLEFKLRFKNATLFYRLDFYQKEYTIKYFNNGVYEEKSPENMMLLWITLFLSLYCSS